MNERLRPRRHRSVGLAGGFLAAYLLVFLVLPVGGLFGSAFFAASGTGNGIGIDALSVFFDNPLYLESLFNSIAAALGAAGLAALAALPVAAAVWRFRLRIPVLLGLFGFVPLFVPTFMLSLSLQALLGRGGALGLLMQPALDLDPARWGLVGLAIVEAIHYFPLVLATLILTTADSARQAHEAAQLGNSWWRLTSRVFLPLGLPGAAFGMAITFLKTLDDLATPLSLGVTNLLAPQAYFRVSTYGFQDPLASMMAVVLIGVSMMAWVASAGFVHRAMPENRPAPVAERHSPRQRHIATIGLSAIAVFYLFCYSGTLLSSLAGIWSHTPLPESYVLSHYASALENEAGRFVNTLVYCGFAAIADVLAGLVMARAIDASPARWHRWLTWAATGLLGVPGVALAIAYLQFFQGAHLPFTQIPLDAPWFLLSMAFSIRGLPFALRSCAFALQQLPPPYLEAAHMSGASRPVILWRVMLPMLRLSLLAAFLICFGVAAMDLSSAMLLVPSETDAPLSYAVYLHMQTATGRGTGAALVVLILIAIATSMAIAALLIRRRRPSAGLRHIVMPESLSPSPRSTL